MAVNEQGQSVASGNEEKAPIQKSEAAPDAAVESKEKGMSLEIAPEFTGFQKVEVTAIDESKPWKPPTEVAVTKGDGSKTEGVDANAAFAIFTTPEGKLLTISIAAAGHVDSLHIRGEEAGSRFDYGSMEELCEDLQDKIPAKVASEPGVSAFAIETGKPMGREGVASMQELLADGKLTSEDVVAAQQARAEVMQLNLEGTKEDKEAFLERFKTENPECGVQFEMIRGGVIVPIVDAPKRETTKLFMVFGPGSGDGKTMYTAAPGRYMPMHPNPDQHKGADGAVNKETFKESSDAWFDTVMLKGE